MAMFNPSDQSFLTVRLQVKAERLAECVPIYHQYQQCWKLCGKTGPLPHDWLVFIACSCGLIDVPDAIPALQPLASVRPPSAGVNGHSGNGKLETNPLESAKRGSLLNFTGEEGVVPARLVKVARTGKVQIRTRVDDSEKTIWVDRSRVALADSGPVVHKVPFTAGTGANTFMLEAVGK